MKSWKKRISLVMSLVMIAAMLSGCICQQLSTTINKDGSGTVKATVGYSKTFIEMMQSDEDEGGTDLSQYTEKVINGTTYYVMEEEVPFATVEEFNEIMAAQSEDSQESSNDVSDLSIQLSRASDASFTLTVTVDITDESEEDNEETVDDEYDLSEGEDGLLLSEMLIQYEFTFPTYMMVTSGNADELLSVNGKKVTLDLMKKPANNAKHVEYVVQSVVLKGFKDVPAGAWFTPYVNRSVELGLFSGVTEPDADGLALFDPDRTITRAEFITVVMRAVAPEETYTAAAGEPWYEPYVYAAVDKGIITKLDLGDMTVPMTREEMAYVLANAAWYSGIESAELAAETDIPDWDAISEGYRDKVLVTYSLKLITGTDERGTFLPKGNLTRGQAATVLVRLAELRK